MIGVKKNVLVFFGLFLVGMLLVPPGIPFMVPEAEAQDNSTDNNNTDNNNTNSTSTTPPASDINLVGAWGYDVVYSVGDTLTITGTGATPGSTVSIGIWDDHRIYGFGIQYVTANGTGGFLRDWVLPADYCCIADTADPFSDGPKPVTQRFEDQHRILVDDGTTTDQGYFSIQDAADPSVSPPTPTVTASAYLNGTSPTGRTLKLTSSVS